MSLASATASASSRKGMTAATGPKISSRAARSSLLTGHSTVGGNQKPGPSGASPRIATGASSSTKEPTCSRWAALMSGPICVSSSSGSPTRSAPTASSSASMKRSRALRSTRMRERAQQSWPALPNTRQGRHRRRLLEVGVGEHDVRALAAQLERDALDRRRRARRDRAPDLGRAGEGDLGHVGVVDEALAALAARPGDDLDHALGQAGLERELGEAQGGERRQLGRLEHHRVAGRQRRAHLPRGDGQREVPRHDEPDHAERLAHGEPQPARHRDGVAQQALGRRGVVAEGVGHHPHLAARVADRLAGVARLEDRELLVVLGRGCRRAGAAAGRGRPAPWLAMPGRRPWPARPLRRRRQRSRAVPRPGPPRLPAR